MIKYLQRRRFTCIHDESYSQRLKNTETRQNMNRFYVSRPKYHTLYCRLFQFLVCTDMPTKTGVWKKSCKSHSESLAIVLKPAAWSAKRIFSTEGATIN